MILSYPSDFASSNLGLKDIDPEAGESPGRRMLKDYVGRFGIRGNEGVLFKSMQETARETGNPNKLLCI
jgi:hypothetical protein